MPSSSEPAYGRTCRSGEPDLLQVGFVPIAATVYEPAAGHVGMALPFRYGVKSPLPGDVEESLLFASAYCSFAASIRRRLLMQLPRRAFMRAC